MHPLLAVSATVVLTVSASVEAPHGVPRVTLTAIDSAGGDFQPGFDVYIGYVDTSPGGHTNTWPLALQWAAQEHARALSVTTTLDWTAAIFDIEQGAESLATAKAFWDKKTTPRPILYVSASSVDTLVGAMQDVARSQYRIFSAHYDWPTATAPQPHICGPNTCGACQTTCDATQWAGTFAGTDTYDVSVLRDDFFATQEQEKRMITMSVLGTQLHLVVFTVEQLATGRQSLVTGRQYWMDSVGEKAGKWQGPEPLPA